MVAVTTFESVHITHSKYGGWGAEGHYYNRIESNLGACTSVVVNKELDFLIKLRLWGRTIVFGHHYVNDSLPH